ncbi:Molybdenum cofactor biosynthesis protein MoaE, Molybdopterin converting factor subunit 2 [Roseibacterium elongatum DSM 19469]|uniref:Molybdopterin synthase catalytic subunit n=1 Tax=Roseicyclus elongatus DSM 19469 TaxID=1294273 RepID=W8SKS4_9RHOB|nr:Molybdenum cofactor biosynthesis protein MoaE, Molybdopterin converting factor subunit 2 [Roseibacterium elongatum DSM 19469]
MNAGVRVQSDSFDMGAVLNAFAAAMSARNAGAVVSFSGLTRDIATGDLDAMEIEHYPGMTEKALAKIRDEAIERFNLSDAMILHRYGRMGPGEPIMMVATAARHRADAFQGAEFLMDYLKSRAPFWKKEITATGAVWVAARDEDEDALSRW